MALPPDEDLSFLREVDDELRMAQLNNWWRQWRAPLIGSIALGLISLGGWEIWQYHRASVSQADSLTFDDTLKALSVGNEASAAKSLASLRASTVPAYRASALMTEASMAIGKGDDKKAVADYGAIIEDKDIPAPFRDAALIRQMALQFDQMPPQQVIDRLKPLAVAGNPWFGSAGEMTGLAYLKMHKQQQAAATFAAIAGDKQVPDSLRQRAVEMAGSLGIDVSDTLNAPAAGNAAAGKKD